MSRRPLTPSQTVGPFFHDGLVRSGDPLVVAAPEVGGQHVRIEGCVRDGAGDPVSDALVEVWQADPDGHYAHPLDGGAGVGFVGFGRAATDGGGRFAFDTVKPGRVRYQDGRYQAPHIVVHVAARGVLDHLSTRLYFADEDNEGDPILERVPAARRTSLVATRTGDHEGGTPVYRFDIVLQGDDETVFFAL